MTMSNPTPKLFTSAQIPSMGNTMTSNSIASSSTQSATQIQPVGMRSADSPFRNLVISVTGHHTTYTHGKFTKALGVYCGGLGSADKLAAHNRTIKKHY